MKVRVGANDNLWWMIRVLEKLRALILYGNSILFETGYEWKFDNDEPNIGEIRALIRLHSNGVIVCDTGLENKYSLHYGYTDEEKEKYYILIFKKVIIQSVNETKFRRCCKDYYVNPDEELYRVDIEADKNYNDIHIKSSLGRKILNIGDSEAAGLALACLRYKPNHQIKRTDMGEYEEIKESTIKKTRINDVFKDDLFSPIKGVLAPFFKADKDSVLFYDSRNLTKEELNTLLSHKKIEISSEN